MKVTNFPKTSRARRRRGSYGDNTQSQAQAVRTIQQGIKELGLKEYEYRAIYQRATGKDSISGKDGQKPMSDKELGLIVAALKRDGFNPSGGTGQGVTLCQTPQAKKIRSLWLTLKKMGALRNSSEQALLAFVQKQIGVSRMEWMQPNQAQWIIETLKQWIARLERERQAANAV